MPAASHGQAGSYSAAGSNRAYAVVLLIVVVFILYGSLFPFEYRERFYPGGPVAYLLSTWRDWDRRGDLLSNILLYLPFGFFATCALPPRIATVLRALLTTVAGTALACGIEIAQFHDAGRVTSMGDVEANAIGAALGAIAAAVIGASLRWPLVRELAAHPAAATLLAMYFGYRLYPYVPMIDLHKYWHALRPILRTPSLPPDELTRYVITWLFIAVVVHSLYGFRGFLLLFPLLCGAEFLGKILIIGNFLKPTDVAGAGVAYLLWVLLRWLPGRFVIVTLAFAAMITAERLEPFQFLTVPNAFGWIPFASFMRGSIGVAMQAFCQKFYEYGGLIWLLGRCGVMLPFGSALTATLLLATSVAECWLAGRSAEITDAVMALVIGGAFALLRRGASARAVAAPPPDVAALEHARFAEAILVQHGVAAATPAPSRRRGRKYAPYVPPHLRG
ncbi:MAG TPA: VanZ family protein [Acetobacteraceae bacterium]|nr:VanZ family protein [Acetobacteraceae bacterium]